MGCLNDDKQFDHWFANIHLSGPCNRTCYFCIGQHMMGQDGNNNLDLFPLINIDPFLEECRARNIRDINLTGTNTDPSLYKHLPKLIAYIREKLPGVPVGIRTNGIMAKNRPEELALFDKGSFSITSMNPEIYKKTMGVGQPPDLKRLKEIVGDKPFKINVVLCPETLENNAEDLVNTLRLCAEAGFTKANLREPYGQPHLDDPFGHLGWQKSGGILGMPQYDVAGVKVTYWDVHYVEVKSVNLYADGQMSLDYSVTKGHHQEVGTVRDQGHYASAGRQGPQWRKDFQFVDRKNFDPRAESYNLDWAESAPFYAIKRGAVGVYPAAQGQRLETRVNDFQVTVNFPNVGDYIITTPGGGEYALSPEKFRKFYKDTPNSKGKYEPRENVPIKMLRITKDIKLVAPWGQMQYIPRGGVLAIRSEDDVYGIYPDNYKAGFTRLIQIGGIQPAVRPTDNQLVI